MLITKKIEKLLNAQVGNEFHAALQYEAISSYLSSETLPVLSAYFSKQATEERQHAQKFIRFINDTDATLDIPAIPKVVSTFKSVESAVKLSLKQEYLVTDQINKIMDQAKMENNHVTENFLFFFIEEQLEEISSMKDLLSIVQRAGKDRMLMVEEYLMRNPLGASHAND